MFAGLAVVLLLAGCGHGAISKRGVLTPGPEPAPEGDSSIQALAVDPENPLTVYAVPNDCDVFKSTNGGGSWRRVGLIEEPSTTFLIGADCAGEVVAAPGGVIYATTLFSGVFKSTNGGGSWQKVGLDGPTLRALALDPQNARTLYVDAGPSLYKSTNGGGGWQQILKHLTVDALAVAPGGQLVYAGTTMDDDPTAHLGVLKSMDGGGSWRTAGLDGHGIVALAVEPQSPTIVYAIGGHAGRDWLFRSSDGGASWKRIGPAKGVSALALDPRHRQVIYAGISSGVAGNLTGRGGGVFKSADGGRTWRRWRLKGDDIPALALPPGGRFLYAGDAEGSVFRIAG
jgi:photosystem II stability/assembly factor-like uncharacterized protein